MAKLAGKKRASKYSQKSAVRKALKKIRSMPRPELKFQDSYVNKSIPDGVVNTGLTNANIVPIESTAAVTTTARSSLVSPDVGATSGQRVGQKIVVKSIQFKGRVEVKPETTGGAGPSMTGAPVARFKLMLVVDKQSNGALPGVGDLLNPAPNAWQVDFHNKIGSADRFHTLWTHTYTVQPSGAYLGTADQWETFPRYQKVEFYKKLNLPVTFAAGSASDDRNASYVRTNNVFMVMMRENTDAVAGTLHLGGVFRVRWEDC